MAVLRTFRWAMLVFLVASVSASAAELPAITHEGRPYVELTRIAATLGARLEATGASTRARLRSGHHVVTFTRNWAQLVVDGTPVVLDAPVRVRGGSWLVPEEFVSRVLPRLASSPAPSPRVAASPASARARVEAETPRAPEASLVDLRVRSYPSFTRLVVETSQPAGWRIETRGPREARVRLVGVTASERAESIGDGLVEDVRVERAGDDAVVRVAFDGGGVDVRGTALTDPPRLMIDLVRPGQATGRERGETTGPLRVLVLDAGHGGHDSGAVGPTGLMEKDLVLDVTRRAARLVEDRLSIKVKLSRDGDYFVPLRERTSFANRERADLFVSIHANAHRESASEGVETYFLSTEATDSAARHVAALENAVVKLEKPTARGRPDFVKSILWDLAQSEYQLESSHLAEIVLDSMTRSLGIPNRGVKQAGFYVLGGAAMPAVLIEIGFVTNPKEERRLRESRYRDDIARAIFDGIVEYKRQWDQRMRAALGRPR
jgi:N-acetylmuramoyl-L-alanine amidase